MRFAAKVCSQYLLKLLNYYSKSLTHNFFVFPKPSLPVLHDIFIETKIVSTFKLPSAVLTTTLNSFQQDNCWLLFASKRHS